MINIHISTNDTLSIMINRGLNYENGKSRLFKTGYFNRNA